MEKDEGDSGEYTRTDTGDDSHRNSPSSTGVDLYLYGTPSLRREKELWERVSIQENEFRGRRWGPEEPVSTNVRPGIGSVYVLRDWFGGSHPDPDPYPVLDVSYLDPLLHVGS